MRDAGRLPTAELRRADFHRILLIKLSSVGDVVHAVPVLAGLRRRFPAAQIDWLVRPDCADLVRCHPALSHALPFPRHASDLRTHGARLLDSLRAVRQGRYDLVVDLHGQFRTGLYALASGAPVRLGFAGWREGAGLAYTHRIAEPTRERHAIERYLWFGERLGFPPGPPELTLSLPPEADAAASALLARHGLAGRPLAVLTPGTVWQTKRWTAEGFAAVARHLAGRGLAVLLAGSAQDRPRAAAVAALCPESVTDLTGKTSVGLLAALIERARLCVTNDSGPMHIAVALGTPVVSVFGPTSPVRTGPWGHPEAVVRSGIACSPCYIRTLRRCPNGHRCLAELPAAPVLAAIDRALDRTPAGQ
ncbi:MAG: lipopolysaccharide heptosyltransferase II [Dongiaceae bacterium]